jgi:hypothetical protein
MKKIIIDDKNLCEIQSAMFEELQKCGSCPPNRFLRMAFVEACKKIGIEIEFAEKRVFNLPKDIMDDIGILVSIAACYDKDTARFYAEKLDKVLKTKE